MNWVFIFWTQFHPELDDDGCLSNAPSGRRITFRGVSDDDALDILSSWAYCPGVRSTDVEPSPR